MKILQKMVDFKIDPKRFDVIKEIYIRGLKNYPTRPLHGMNQWNVCSNWSKITKWSIELLRYYTSLITSEHYWSYEELLDTSNYLTIDNIQQFLPLRFSRFHIEALIHGNIERADALNVCQLFEDHFKTSRFQTRAISLSQHIRNREIQLVEGSEFAFETTNAVHQTKAIEVYIQVGVQDTQSNALLELVNQLMNEPFYNKLRTQEQLGYLTFSSIRRSNGVQGIVIIHV